MQQNNHCTQATLSDRDRLEDLLSQEKYLINAYHLEYGDHVSRSFTDFVFNEDDTTPMAILKLRTSLAEVPAEKEDVEEDEIVFDEEDWTDDTEDSEN